LNTEITSDIRRRITAGDTDGGLTALVDHLEPLDEDLATEAFKLKARYYKNESRRIGDYITPSQHRKELEAVKAEILGLLERVPSGPAVVPPPVPVSVSPTPPASISVAPPAQPLPVSRPIKAKPDQPIAAKEEGRRRTPLLVALVVLLLGVLTAAWLWNADEDAGRVANPGPETSVEPDYPPAPEPVTEAADASGNTDEATINYAPDPEPAETTAENPAYNDAGTTATSVTATDNSEVTARLAERPSAATDAVTATGFREFIEVTRDVNPPQWFSLRLNLPGLNAADYELWLDGKRRLYPEEDGNGSYAYNLPFLDAVHTFSLRDKAGNVIAERRVNDQRAYRWTVRRAGR